MRSPVKFVSALACALALGALLSAASAAAQGQYRVVQSTGALIDPGTTQVAGSGCDDCVASVPLPFNFVHYGQTFPANTPITVSSNGNIQFASSSADYGQGNVCFPLSQFGSAILAHWTDIQTGGPGEGVFTSVTGSAPNRVFNVEWRASYEFFTPGSLNFEIRLFESPGPSGQRFEIVYGTLAGSGASAPGDGISIPAVGAQGGAGLTHVSSACGLVGGGVRGGLRLAFVEAPSPSIHGRATNTEGQPLSGVTVTLSGASSGSQTTGADGTYSFTGLTLSSAYTVSASDAGGSNYYPKTRSFPAGTAVASFNGTRVVNFVRTPAPQARNLLISEFRLRGPGIVRTEDFVELYNNTNSTIVVNTSDGTSGWLVLSPNGRSFILSNGLVIPPRRNFLISGTGYSSLYQYAPGDDFYSGDIATDSGVAVFGTANAANLNASTRLDAAGFTTACAPGVEPCVFREGAGLAPIGAVSADPAVPKNDTEFSYVRRLRSGTPQDTDDNVADFALVSVGGGLIGGVQSVLGAPGPENLVSHVQRNAQVKSSMIGSCTGQSEDPDSTCTRVRLQASDPSEPNDTFGTLLIRRRWTNRSGVALTRLRFRIVDITTLNSPGYVPGGTQADLRVLDSQDRSIGGFAVALSGMTVEDGPPSQPNGGGLNTSLRVNEVALDSPLAPNASVNVEFRLGVVQRGSFRFFVNVEAVADEALPSAPGGAAPSRPSRSASSSKKTESEK